MHLRDCPYFEVPVPQNERAWICWRPINKTRDRATRNTPSAQSVDKTTPDDLYAGAKAGGETAAPTETSTGAEYLGEEVLTICSFFNGPGNTACASPLCGGLRNPQHSSPACPICKIELPQGILQPKTLTITGPVDAGKTHFIIALTEWWTYNLSRFGLQAKSFMRPVVQEYFENCRSDLLKHKKKLPATLHGRTLSFTWQITKSDDPNAPGMLCTMPDISGEGLLKREFLMANQHYRSTSGIVLLLDGNRIAHLCGLADCERDPADHLKLVDEMLAELQRLHQNKGFRDLPVAVCVNKVDYLAELDDEWKAIVRDYTPNHDGETADDTGSDYDDYPERDSGFDYERCFKRSQKIKMLLKREKRTAAVVEKLCKAFDYVMFFPVATIGSKEVSISYEPLNVEDPFLWLLFQNSMLEAV